MKEEYDFQYNARKNPYINQLEKLIDDAMSEVDNNFGMPSAKQMAEYLASRGVTIKDDSIVILPVPVGTTLYRIDRYSKHCSYHCEHRESNLYYCINDWKCKHLCDGLCDAGFEYKIYTINNADARTILGNAELFGTDRLFLNKDDAERELSRKQAEEIELRKKRGKELPQSYEGYREYWDDECEDEDD